MLNQNNYLPQIDGLRALAVGSVIVYHFYEHWLPSGFLGVDIFFVISGFVITGYLARTEASNWQQYLGDFYVKRIKRLLPALLFCIVISSIAIVTLGTMPSPDNFATGASALFGLSNVLLLLKSADYFALDSSINAFSHTWTLGVEEQFYFFYPMVMFALGLTHRKSNRIGLASILAITIISFLIYIILHQFFPMSAFYLLPARAWELGAGALTYFIFKRNSMRLPRWLSWISFTAVIGALFFPPSQIMVATIIAVIGTSVLIASLSSQTIVYKILSFRPMVFVGLISYSLYLWHWPILVIGKLTIGTLGWASVLLLFLTVVMSLFSYYLVERPLRHMEWFRSSSMTLGVSLSIICILAPAIWGASKLVVSPVPAAKNDGCYRLAVLAHEDPIETCLSASRSNEKPNVVYLIGDSHAGQLSKMFNKALSDTKYSLRSINLYQARFPQYFLKKNANSEALDYVVLNSEKDDVLAIAFHRGYLNFNRETDRDKHVPVSTKIEIGDKGSYFIENISRYISALQRKQVNVLFVRDTPLMNAFATIPACLKQFRLHGKSPCRISKEQDLHTRKRQDLVYDKLSLRFSSVCTWDPFEGLYVDKPYFEVVDELGKYLMRDKNHLTKYGSEKLAPAFWAGFKFCYDK